MATSPVLSGVILLAGLISASCSDVVPTEPTASDQAAAAAPSRPNRPESRRSSCRRPDTCGGARPFRTRFVLILGGIEGFVLQDLQVGFNDRFGVILAPAVVGASATPTSMNGSLAAGPDDHVHADTVPDDGPEQRPPLGYAADPERFSDCRGSW